MGVPALMSGGGVMSRNNRNQGGPLKPSPPREEQSGTPPTPSTPSPSLQAPPRDRTALIVAVVALAGSVLAATVSSVSSYLAARANFDAQMVQVGIAILSADPGKSDVTPARQWAIDLVGSHSGQPFLGEDREKLLHHPIQTLPVRPGFALSGVPCDALQHNPDGSWIILQAKSGNTTFDHVLLANTPETKIFDQYCGQDRAGSR
jgi:hypothetical protein